MPRSVMLAKSATERTREEVRYKISYDESKTRDEVGSEVNPRLNENKRSYEKLVLSYSTTKGKHETKLDLKLFHDKRKTREEVILRRGLEDAKFQKLKLRGRKVTLHVLHHRKRKSSPRARRLRYNLGYKR